MLWAFFGVFTFLLGVWALSQGRLKISKAFLLEGIQARIAGIVLMVAPIIGLVVYFIEEGDLSYIFGSSCYAIIGVLAFAAYQAWRSKSSPKRGARKKSESAASRKESPTLPPAERTQPAPSGVESKQEKPNLSATNVPKHKEIRSADLPPRKLSIPTCPKCGMKVLPKSDGTCPSCHAKIVRP